MCDYLQQFPGASDIKHQLETAADGLHRQYVENKRDDWHWFEDAMTYDNAILPYALIVAGITRENSEHIKAGLQACEFLLENTFDGEHFSFVGCNGWYEHGKTKAQFDQQPIEPASTVLMLRAAYDATGDIKFLALQRKAFDWFLGENDLHIPLYDYRTQGCCDALMAGGVNLNQGAESLLSFLIALLAIDESHALIHKHQHDIVLPAEDDTTTAKPQKESTPIQTSPPKDPAKKNWIEEPA
jgi:hypothetical protein